MTTVTTSVVRVDTIADETLLLTVTKPSGYTYAAGQYATVRITHPSVTDARGSARALSYASAPSEEHLLFAVRTSESAYKQSFAALTSGDAVDVMGPLGKFILPDDVQTPVVFLVGGIGITPVRSMVVEAHAEGVRPMALFYSNRTPASSAFLDELTPMLNDGNSLCIATMTEELPEGVWWGVRGFITRELLEKNLTAQTAFFSSKTRFYVVGPDGFIKAMKTMLVAMHITDERVMIDNFGSFATTPHDHDTAVHATAPASESIVS